MVSSFSISLAQHHVGLILILYILLMILTGCSGTRESRKDSYPDWSKKAERSSMLVLHLEYYKTTGNKDREKTIPDKLVVSNKTLSLCASGGFIYKDYLIIPNIKRGIYKIKSIVLPDNTGGLLTLAFTDDTLRDSNHEIRKFRVDWSNKTVLYKSIACDIPVKKPGVYYLGSYKIEGSFIKEGDFSFTINRQKNDRQELREIKEYINSSRSGWQKSTFTTKNAFYFPAIRLF